MNKLNRIIPDKYIGVEFTPNYFKKAYLNLKLAIDSRNLYLDFLNVFTMDAIDNDSKILSSEEMKINSDDILHLEYNIRRKNCENISEKIYHLSIIENIIGFVMVDFLYKRNVNILKLNKNEFKDIDFKLGIFWNLIEDVKAKCIGKGLNKTLRYINSHISNTQEKLEMYYNSVSY